jgi:hypothetical protein
MTETTDRSAEAGAKPGSAARAIDLIVGLAMIGLAFVGFALTDAADRLGRDYWLICVVLFALASLWMFWHHRKEGFRFWPLVGRLLIHWAGALGAIFLIYGFVGTGRIDENSAGLIGALTLGLTTYLAGVHGSWRLLAIGVAIGLGTVAAAFVEQFIWVLLGLALAVIAAMLFGDRLTGSRQSDA